jgi:ribonucleotide monophosphatase NagD (HAD superfamily)
VADLLISDKGRPGTIGVEQGVDLYLSNSSLTFDGFNNYPYPRFTQGAFPVCLEEMFKKVYPDRQIHSTHFGKPHQSQFTYAHQTLLTQSTTPLTSLYMIGDSPQVDILGANRAHWTSILV